MSTDSGSYSHWICSPSITATIAAAVASTSAGASKSPSLAPSIDRRRDHGAQPLIAIEEPGPGGMRFGRSLDGQHRVHLGGHRLRHVAGHGVHQVLQQLSTTRQLATGRLLQAEEIPLLEELDEQGLLGLEVVQQSGGRDARALATSARVAL